MLRFIALLLIAAGSAGQVWACEMSTAKRASVVADYIENGQDCLQNPVTGYTFDTAMEQAYIDRINAERRKHDLPALTVRSDLQAPARFHSLDMGVNGFFDHTSPQGKTHAARIAAFDRTLLPQISAENIAKLELSCDDGDGRAISCAGVPNGGANMLAGSVEQLHRQLMGSAEHRKNILAPDTTHIALGVVRREHAVYVTQLFASVAGVLDRPMPVRVHAGTEIEVTAQVPDWSFKRFALMRGNLPDDLSDGRIPVATRGDLGLGVRAERNGATKQVGNKITETYQFIYMTGPAFTVIEPKESSQSAPRAS